MREGAAVFTPTEMTTLSMKRLETLSKSKHRAVPLHIPVINDYFAPLMPGQVCAVIAQTSNFKSGLMDGWAEHLAKNVASHESDEIVVKIDVETPVEEAGISKLAKVSGQDLSQLAQGNVTDWNALYEAAFQINKIGVYRVSTSIERADDVEDLPLSAMKREVDYLRSKALGRPLKIVALVFDYLQAFAIDPEIKRADVQMQRRLQVRSDIYRIRQLATYFDAPAIVGVQAKQTLNGAAGPNMQIPGIYDAEETSSIAQRVDRAIQLWMPKTTHQVGNYIKHGDYGFEVTDNTIFVKVGKQRGNLPAGKSWRCFIDYKSGMIAPAGN